jgi:hypothetical protein
MDKFKWYYGQRSNHLNGLYVTRIDQLTEDKKPSKHTTSNLYTISAISRDQFFTNGRL